MWPPISSLHHLPEYAWLLCEGNPDFLYWKLLHWNLASGASCCKCQSKGLLACQPKWNAHQYFCVVDWWQVVWSVRFQNINIATFVAHINFPWNILIHHVYNVVARQSVGVIISCDAGIFREQDQRDCWLTNKLPRDQTPSWWAPRQEDLCHPIKFLPSKGFV